jgi:hypothetical protein
MRRGEVRAAVAMVADVVAPIGLAAGRNAATPADDRSATCGEPHRRLARGAPRSAAERRVRCVTGTAMDAAPLRIEVTRLAVRDIDPNACTAEVAVTRVGARVAPARVGPLALDELDVVGSDDDARQLTGLRDIHLPAPAPANPGTLQSTASLTIRCRGGSKLRELRGPMTEGARHAVEMTAARAVNRDDEPAERLPMMAKDQ